MRFNVFFTIKGPAATLECPNATNPVECADLATLLRRLSENLPGNRGLGLEVVALRVEAAPGGGGDEFDPLTGEKLTGESQPCCGCCEEYPRADLVLRGEIYCPACRAKPKGV